MSIAIASKPLPLATTDDVGITKPAIALPCRLMLAHGFYELYDDNGAFLGALADFGPTGALRDLRKQEAEYIRDAINATVDAV